MSRFIVKKGTIKGKITLPPSKSQTLRAILFGAMGKGKTVIHRYLESPDAYAMIEACRSLGAEIAQFPDRLEIRGINGKIKGAEDVIQAGNSGLVLRLIAALAGLSLRPIVITGDYSIRHQRPMNPLLEGLKQLGVTAVSTKEDGYAPVIIQGPFKGGIATVNGCDSQPVSALLIAGAFSPCAFEVQVLNPGEKPWIDLTLSWLKRLGIPFEHNGHYSYYKMQGSQGYDGFEYTVPGDLSSAAFPLAAGLVTGSEVTLLNADMRDGQGDKQLIEVFQKMGARLEIDEEQKKIHLRKSPSLKGVDVNINDFVDSITILAATACYAEGETRIRNAAVARQKECDRIACVAHELQKFGAKVIEHVDGLSIFPSRLKGTALFSHHDHRMAMSLAVAGFGAEGITTIESVECVSKTFPGFASQFSMLGAQIKEEG